MADARPLGVSARDLRTGQEHSIEVKPSYGLTDDQIEKMLIESFEFAEEDIRKRQLVEARTAPLNMHLHPTRTTVFTPQVL